MTTTPVVGSLRWHLAEAKLKECPLWTDVRVALAVGCSRRLVARVRKSLPPAAGKRLARDGKAYTPRGEARKAAVDALAASPGATDYHLAEQAGIGLSTMRGVLRAAGVESPREARRVCPPAVPHPCG